MANPRLAPNALLKPSQTTKPSSFSRQRKSSRYEILKDKIKTWWEDRFKVGECLKEIKEGKLYSPEYATFEEFSEGEFGIKQAYAYRLIEASDVRASLGNSTIVEKLDRPSQATALAKVPAEQRVVVVERAASGNGKVTAKAITEAAENITPKKAAHTDKTGYAIPAEILEDWREAESFDDLIKQLHRVKLRVEKALEINELPFRELTNSITADLKNAWTELQRVIPYAVCPTCGGHNRKSCTLCKQRGFVSRFGYEHWVPKKTREIREAAIKK